MVSSKLPDDGCPGAGILCSGNTHTNNTRTNNTNNANNANNASARKGRDGEAQFEEAQWNTNGKVGGSTKVWWDVCPGSKQSYQHLG